MCVTRILIALKEVLPECPVIPGYLFFDVIEYFFCQQRGICHGLNTNPSIKQYGPAVNSIIISQKTISRKSNGGCSSEAAAATAKKPRKEKEEKEAKRIKGKM